MNQFKVLSLDMFQTLVNVNTRVSHIWKKILQNDYQDNLAKKYGKQLMSIFTRNFHTNSNRKEFIKIKDMFELSAKKLFSDLGLEYDYKLASKIIIEEHSKSEKYKDVNYFFKNIKEEIPICLVSDADKEMILPLLKKFSFDNVYISEEIKAYKGNKRGLIFKQLINDYKVKPEEILHIGDGYSDIYGAKKLGIKACWLNRNNKDWDNDIKPDYRINNLKEAISQFDI